MVSIFFALQFVPIFLAIVAYAKIIGILYGENTKPQLNPSEKKQEGFFHSLKSGEWTSADTLEISYGPLTALIFLAVITIMYFFTQKTIILYLMTGYSLLRVLSVVARPAFVQKLFLHCEEYHGISKHLYSTVNRNVSISAFSPVIFQLFQISHVFESVFRPDVYGTGAQKVLFIFGVLVYVYILLYIFVISIFFIVGANRFHKQQAQIPYDEYFDADEIAQKERAEFARRFDTVAEKYPRTAALLWIFLLGYVLKCTFVEEYRNIRFGMKRLRIQMSNQSTLFLEEDCFSKINAWIRDGVIIVLLIAVDLALSHYYSLDTPVVRLYEMFTTLVVLPIAINKISS